MIATKNWVRCIKFEIIKQVKIVGLASIFQLAAAETTIVVAPITYVVPANTKEFPGADSVCWYICQFYEPV